MSERNPDYATLGGGCFWCLEALFQSLRGVASVVSGNAGADWPDPTYDQVCSGATGHAEVVRIGFDPAVITYGDLLRLFFVCHDPTSLNRQGHDVGTQYRSIILTEGQAQAETAQAVRAEIDGLKLWPAPIVTQIEPLRIFYPAEYYHQNYFRRNPGAGYCQAVVAPKLAAFRKKFVSLMAE